MFEFELCLEIGTSYKRGIEDYRLQLDKYWSENPATSFNVLFLSFRNKCYTLRYALKPYQQKKWYLLVFVIFLKA